MRPGRRLLIVHGIALLLLLLSATSSDSGGSGTEALVLGLWVIGWCTVLVGTALLVRALLKKPKEEKDVAMLVILVIVGFLESRVADSDANAFRSLFS